MTPCGVLETALYAADLEAAEQFYHGILGMPVHSHDPGRMVFFRCGDGMLLVFNPDYTVAQDKWIGGGSIPPHGARGVGHAAFAIAESEIEAWRARLKAAGVAIESEVCWPQGGHSLYFRDPAGNSLELATPALWGIQS
ncbi:MAG: VOC family protein [Gemmataceae bacterium]